MVSDKILIQADPELQDLIPGYLENRKKELSALRDALTLNDFATLQSMAHKIKGNSAGYGFAQMSEIGARMEQAAKAQDRDGVQKNLDELTDYLARVEVTYG